MLWMVCCRKRIHNMLLVAAVADEFVVSVDGLLS